MSSKRRSNEAGHKRKYLVVIDDTEECDRAVFWAAKRAQHAKSSQIVMLRVIEPGERNQQWLGVADIMKAEAEEASNAALDKYAARIKEIAGIVPDRAIREGDPAAEMLKLIEEDADIGILVLAAGVGKDGPGPLVSSVAKTSGSFPIPVAIVPGHLSDEDLEALS
jgi:nucleotide-binding universal stress UspA family protein